MTLLAIAIVPLWNERVLDRAAERKSSDPLRAQSGGNFLQLMPQTFRITFEECVEEAFYRIDCYPVFEIPRIRTGNRRALNQRNTQSVDLKRPA